MEIDRMAVALFQTMNLKPTGPDSVRAPAKRDRSVLDIWKPVPDDFWKHLHAEVVQRPPRRNQDVEKLQKGTECIGVKCNQMPSSKTRETEAIFILDMAVVLRDMKSRQEPFDQDSVDMVSLKLYKSRWNKGMKSKSTQTFVPE